MLHIVRKNETLEDIAKIYATEADKIAQYNFLENYGLLCENTGVWVPNGRYTVFLNEEIGAGQEHVFPLFASGIRKNTKIEKEYTSRGLSAYGLFTCRQGETPFVPIDLYGRVLERIYLDIYEPNAENLNLPNDYPAINACDINHIEACFLLRKPKEYLNKEMLNQLLYDLSFKNYPRALIVADDEDEMKYAGLLAHELQTERYKTDIAAPISILEAAPLSDFSEISYMTEGNVFDFESFEENINKLCAVSSPEKMGVVYTARGADINKTTHTLSNIALKDVYDLLKREKIEKILFDDRTQLCFVSYTADEQTHNVLFEDYRSLYAKARLMLEKGVDKIIFPGLSYETVCLCGVLDMLEYAADTAGV
jgi:hypothetical protein